MKQINAKFKSKCAETNIPINKGDLCYYDYNVKKCYSVNSKVVQKHLEAMESKSINDYIAAQEEAFYNNQY